jgi:hypothetical protein
LADPLDWLAQHQDTLTWLGGGVATAAGGVWVAVRYLLDRDRKKSSLDKKPAFPKSAGPTISTGTGISTAGHMQVGGNVSIEHNSVPKAAIALAVLGLLLLGYAFYNSGSRINVSNGSFIGGNATNSPVTIGPSKPQAE